MQFGAYKVYQELSVPIIKNSIKYFYMLLKNKQANAVKFDGLEILYATDQFHVIIFQPTTVLKNGSERQSHQKWGFHYFYFHVNISIFTLTFCFRKIKLLWPNG